MCMKIFVSSAFFQNYRTRCARAVISKNASITNIFIPASFGNTNYHMPSNVKSISAWSAVISTSALWHPHCRKLFDDKLSLYWRHIVTICRYMPRLYYMKKLSRWRHTVKDLPNSAVYEDMCDLGVFQNYRTRCARAVISKNASITNIFIPASFGNT